ncbi:MAG TPA: 4-(cytidine 5'-diphospho)-2-C-methyl-D-erythritol kinase [Allosphingosinicella sp.]|jgi:4-diphosphocytidyl-2-C-methyl-D-erythritol kinase
MDETAFAKINLALRVQGKRADGYHELDTLFVFAEDGDRLSVDAGERISLRVVGPFAGDLGDLEDNLVLRAARLLGAGGGAALTLDKRLPVSSGIGGGSADAAAALRLLRRWWRLDLAAEDLLGLAREIGADVPACLLSRTIRGKGRGDQLVGVRQQFGGTPVLLVNPGVPVSTAEVFARWKRVRGHGNDLEPPALEIAPVIGEVIDLLHSQPGVSIVRMSGSGATCFALFDTVDGRDSADAVIAAIRPSWWRLASRLR